MAPCMGEHAMKTILCGLHGAQPLQFQELCRKCWLDRVNESWGLPCLEGMCPELKVRVLRMSLAQRLSPEQIVTDAVGVAWVRHACRMKLKPEKW